MDGVLHHEKYIILHNISYFKHSYPNVLSSPHTLLDFMNHL